MIQDLQDTATASRAARRTREPAAGHHPTPAATDAVVRLEGVRRHYDTADGRVEALRGVDLRVERGTIQGVIGFSGAGKSTLVRCLGLLEQPDAGRVWIGETDVAALRGAPLRDARRRIGMVFQQYNLLRSRTVAGNVALPLELAGVPAAEVRARVAEVLRWMGLEERAGSYPAQLSGGQRQRVAIARALAGRPDVLLTDEPTSALDPETTTSVLALLRRIRDELGVTILLITHEMASVRAICDRVAVLEHGRIVEEGPTRDVLLRPRSSAARRLLRTDARLDGLDAVDAAPSTGREPVRWELQFLGNAAGQPVVSEVIRRFDLTINFLSGQIDRLGLAPYGWLVVDVMGADAEVAAALAYLRERGVHVRPVVAEGGDA